MKTAYSALVMIASIGILIAMVTGVVLAQKPDPPVLSEADRIAIHEINHEQDGLKLEQEKLGEALQTEPEVKAYNEKQAELKRQQAALNAEGAALQKKLEPKYPALKDAQSRQDALTKKWEALQTRILKEKGLDPKLWEVNPQMGAITKRPKP